MIQRRLPLAGTCTNGLLRDQLPSYESGKNLYRRRGELDDC